MSIAQKHKTFKFYEKKKVLNLEISNFFGLFQSSLSQKLLQIEKLAGHTTRSS